jgi:hypothetical protein
VTNAEKRRRISASRKAPASASTGGDGAAPTANRNTLFAQARYRFDLALSRGPIVVIGYLGLVMLAIIAVSSVLLWALRLKGVNGGGPVDNPFDAFWQALLRVVDSGTFAGDATWPTRLLALAITISGIFLAGSLIGLIANAVDQQIEQLRKGRSNVLESGHTLVLGWSPRLPTILSELVEANSNQRHAALVVLADVPKDEMEDELRLKVPDTGTTRVVCRTGDPARPSDLDLVNAAEARSIIVLAGAEGDAGVVKAVLAARSLDPGFARAHVVAELESIEYARTLTALTDGRIVTVQADEVIARVTAQACHQAGLSEVFRDLLDFDGDEIYFTRVAELDGHPYRDVLLAFDRASVLGWQAGDGSIELNPSPDAPFPVGAEVISVAEDDDTVTFSGFPERPQVRVDLSAGFTEPAQRVLMVGWSEIGPAAMAELDEFLPEGSSIDLVIDPDLLGVTSFTGEASLRPPLPETRNTAVEVSALGGGPERLLTLTDRPYDQVIVMGYRHGLTIGESDARTMLTLLTLEKAWPAGSGGPRVVAEILDRTNVTLAQTTGIDDFIVSDELSSLMIAQLSERLELGVVFDELFDADGCFVSLHPSALYVPDGEADFAEVVAAAAARGESAFGYRVGGRVAVNPAKSDRVAFGPGDQVLVLGPR